MPNNKTTFTLTCKGKNYLEDIRLFRSQDGKTFSYLPIVFEAKGTADDVPIPYNISLPYITTADNRIIRNHATSLVLSSFSIF